MPERSPVLPVTAAPRGYASGGCWFNPTRGFQPYAAAPVYREAVVYYRYWPDKWYGESGFNLRPMFPQVYMPTDTTQLGFYYARVPQWMPNPNMYPPRPNPADWHRHVIYAGGEGGSCNCSECRSERRSGTGRWNAGRSRLRRPPRLRAATGRRCQPLRVAEAHAAQRRASSAVRFSRLRPTGPTRQPLNRPTSRRLRAAAK